jgi:phosphoribosylaminoimidazole-succinocarboxamide synthase
VPDDVRVEATRRYPEALEKIPVEAFVPDMQEPRGRIARSLEIARWAGIRRA